MNFGKKGGLVKRTRLLVPLFVLIVLWTVALGWGVAIALEPSTANPNISANKSVDPVPERFQLGQELYLEHCGSCHIAIPPAVFPTETWKQLLQNPQEHYGRSLPMMSSPEVLLMWDYLSLFSRPLSEEEKAPYRFALSRYFNLLHPRVKLPDSVTVSTCVSCHIGAERFDFRSLAPEWDDAP